MGNQLRHTRTHLNMMGVVEVFGEEEMKTGDGAIVLTLHICES